MTVDPFTSAWNSETNDASTNAALLNQYDGPNNPNSDKAIYNQRVIGMFAEKFRNNPMELLEYILWWMFSNKDPSDDGNILGLEDDQIGITGQEIRTMGDNTLVTDALQNLTTGTGTSTPGYNDLETYTMHLDTLLDALGGPQGGGPLQNNQLLDALGAQVGQEDANPGTMVQTLRSKLFDLRQMIYWKDDPTNSSYNPTDPNSAYFNPENAYDPTTNPNGQIGYFSSQYGKYGMIALMSQKGDIAKSTDAAGAVNDDMSILSSSTQSVNASLNERVSQQTSMEKSVQSFFTAIVKDIIDIVNAVVQNYGKT
jgi:hypothetical protein